MSEFEFEREVLDRLKEIEVKLDMVTQQCPASQSKIHQLEIALAKQEASTSAAHYRIDGAYKTVAWITGAITLLINLLAFVAIHLRGGMG